MSRPTNRTELFSLDDAKRIASLFGTPTNAHRLLGAPIPISELRRALSWQPITPEHAHALKVGWARWRRYFGLRNDVINYDYYNMFNPGRDSKNPIHPRDAQAQIHEERTE